MPEKKGLHQFANPSHIILWPIDSLQRHLVVFWVITQPVNRYWLRSQQLKGLGAKFFSIDAKQQPDQAESVNKDWKAMRDRWEYSHLLRAILSGIALIALLVTIVI
jgi:hypothetical protein